MTLLARLRAAGLKTRLARYAAEYEEPFDPAAAASIQLELLNAAWKASLERSPWARAMRERYQLPDSFASWQLYDRLVPVMDKRDLRAIIDTVSPSSSKHEVKWRSTGGSTGAPFRFPTWRTEHALAGLDIWLGRQRLGVDPDDRLFLLWGHAHALGSGFTGALRKLQRSVSDRLLGYCRVSAYRLSAPDLERACDALLRTRPRYVVGYSSALDRFARVNAARRDDIAKLELKVVIATAEGYPNADSREAIAACFHAPVAMEYGSVETGPIAYEDRAGAYQAFWKRHRLERRGGDNGGSDELVVTSLYPRAMPLLRYPLGDLCEFDEPALEGQCVRTIARITGRCNDLVYLPTGERIHSEVFTHSMRDIAGVTAFQIVANTHGLPILRYEAAAELAPSVVAEVRRRLGVVHPSLALISFEHAPRLAKSVAGKHRMVVEAS